MIRIYMYIFQTQTWTLSTSNRNRFFAVESNTQGDWAKYIENERSVLSDLGVPSFFFVYYDYY